MEENRLRSGRRLEVQRLGSIAHSSQRLCVVTETYPPDINGVAITLALLVNGLRARGNRVSVVYPTPRRQLHPQGSYDTHLNDVQVLGMPLPGYHGLQFGAPAARLLKQAWSVNPPTAVY